MEHKLLIETVTKSHAKILGLFKTKRLVQNKPFEYGVRIKNISDFPFNGGKITSVKFEPTLKSYNILSRCKKEFSVESLNPQESTVIWFDKEITSIDGALWLTLNINANDIQDKIFTYTWDELDKIPYQKRTNEWYKTLFVTNESAIQQQTTNYLL